MATRARAETGPELAAQLRTHLKAYTAFVGAVDGALKDVNQSQSELDTDRKPLPLVRPRLERQLEVVGEQAHDEMKRIDFALETIDMLLAIQHQEAQQAQAQAALQIESTSDPSTPASLDPSSRVANSARAVPSPQAFPISAFAAPLTTTPAPYIAPVLAQSFGSHLQQQQALQQQLLQTALQQQQKPKFINSAPIVSTVPVALPASPRRASSVASNVSNGSNPEFISGMGLGAMPSAHGTSQTSASGSTSARKESTSTKTRRDALAGQLPLKAGRQVAFRQPKKDAALKEEWILARIENPIGGDKNRYVVYDVDYDPENPTLDAGKFNTTLKSIVPLPDPRDRVRTYPEFDYPKGTQVMALYPDTTSFYSAKIVAGPLIEKNRAKKEQVYHVVFDEDGGKVEPVPVELVVEIPN